MHCFYAGGCVVRCREKNSRQSWLVNHGQLHIMDLCIHSPYNRTYCGRIKVPLFKNTNYNGCQNFIVLWVGCCTVYAELFEQRRETFNPCHTLCTNRI